jgi:hypothetical protein
VNGHSLQVRLHKYTHTLLHFKPLKSSAAMPPTQDRGARLFLGRTHHRDAPVSTAVGPLTGIPRWDTWQGRAAPSLPLSLSPPSPTYHRAPDSVPIPRGEGLPEWWALRGSGRVSPWPEVRTYRRASLPLPLGRERCCPKEALLASTQLPRVSGAHAGRHSSGRPRIGFASTHHHS